MKSVSINVFPEKIRADELDHISSHFEGSKLDMPSTPEKRVNESRCYLYEIYHAEPHNVLPRSDVAAFFHIRRYHIEKYNEISGSMMLTIGAIIEFANETRDDIPSTQRNCH